MADKARRRLEKAKNPSNLGKNQVCLLCSFKSLYDMLRHTYATMLFDAGVDVKSAQRFLGHTDIEVTLSIYTHLTKFKEEQAIQMLDKHLKEAKKEPRKPLLRVL